jgi:cell division septation protein DedD
MTMQRFTFFALALLLAVLPLAGCKSKPTAESEPFIASYRSGMYDKAYQQAEARAGSSSGLAHDRAALMAGLSAYALRRPDQAERWLNPLLENQDKEVSGVSGWTLAMIAADKGSHTRAASLATAAADKLEGDDAARAHVVAAEALSRTGRAADAKEQYGLALQDARDAGLQASIQSKMAGGAGSIATPTGKSFAAPVAPTPHAGKFVIQLGAFAERAKAEQAARQSRTATTRAGQPPAQVVTATDPKTGSALYAVQVGPFPDRPTAEMILRRLAIQGTVMMAHH